MEVGVVMLLGFMAGFPGVVKLISKVLERINVKGSKKHVKIPLGNRSIDTN